MHNFVSLGFYFVSGAASIIGSILSFFAWRSASSARDAAREARRAAHRTEAADALRELNQHASELLDFIQTDRIQGAGIRARDLFSDIGGAKTRWSRFFDNDGKQSLDAAQERVRKVSLGITAATAPVEPEAKQKLVAYVHTVIGSLSDVLSELVAKLEQEDEGDRNA